MKKKKNLQRGKKYTIMYVHDTSSDYSKSGKMHIYNACQNYIEIHMC